ncbi:aldehyde dehydrogenase [Pseudomonas kuykendallii]|uniref:Aldehyde dehydrogenase n=1 Tax=Pseudomonas kuykendallii TaxID=1007099 RepID=A0A1H3DST5_9PSED|nr:aldehyde dehydrogenase [Pseudomonas kuykendallii]
MRYAVPNTPGSVLTLKPRYGNYIGGEFVPPVKGRCFTDTSPVNGSVIDEFPHSSAADIYKALDAAHAAAETWGNGKTVRETLNADVPLSADHFRYCAGCIRDNSRPGSL